MMSDEDVSVGRFVRSQDRKEAFRKILQQIKRDVRNDRYVDSPARIAWILEQAFNAGTRVGDAPEKPAKTTTQEIANSIMSKRRPQVVRRCMSESSLPVMRNSEFEHFKRGVGRNHDGGLRDAESEGLVLLRRPADLRQMPWNSRNEWFNHYTDGRISWSDDLVAGFVEVGLYEAPVDLGDGWAVTYMSEWASRSSRRARPV